MQSRRPAAGGCRERGALQAPLPMPARARRLLVLLGACVAIAAPAVGAETLRFDRDDLVPRVREVAVGETVTVTDLWLDGDDASTRLALQRYEVWEPGAVLRVDGVSRPPPTSGYFRGVESGHHGSTVLLTVSERGDIDGFVLRGESVWSLHQDTSGSVLASRRVEVAGPLRHHECATQTAPAVSEGARQPPLRDAAAADRRPASADRLTRAAGAAHASPPHHTTLAIETDFEYYERFLAREDPVGAAFDYLATLIGYGDVVFSREIGTSLGIGYAELWTQGRFHDPWTRTRGSEALRELRSYWNAHLRHVKRSGVLFLSGKSIQGGSTFLGELCSSYGFRQTSSDFSFAGGITGGFFWSGVAGDDPAADPLWDIIVSLHELGHLFSAPDTRHSCGLGDTEEPVDRCNSGCAGPAEGLPPCDSPTPHFPGGPGTLMSHCNDFVIGDPHISLTFGEGHTCGVLPERVPQAMREFLADTAARFPECVAASPDPTLTVLRTGDGFGSVTVEPAGISCPPECSVRLAAGTEATLSAAADTGSAFEGWSGAGCSGTGTCIVTMDQPTSVRAEFSLFCLDDFLESRGDDVCPGPSMSPGSSSGRELCDEDWFYFHADAGATYRIQTSGLTGGANTRLDLFQLELLAECGPLLAANDDDPDGGLGSRIEWTAPADMFASVRVASADAFYGAQQGYQVAIDCVADCRCSPLAVLHSFNVFSTRSFKVLTTLSARDIEVVGPDGDLTFHAGESISLGDGFSVGAGARFRAIAGSVPACP